MRIVEAPRAQLQDHVARGPRSGQRRCCADRLPRPPAPGRAREHGRAVLHARERRALPRDGRGARHRRARASPSTSTASTRRSRSGTTRSGARTRVDDLDDYCAFVREETDLKLGIEADYVPGREDRMAQPARRRATGTTSSARSTSCGDESLDTEEFSVWTQDESAERIWKRYFETLGEAAQSGLFDILAHPDLVKVWGKDRPLPEGDLRRFYYPAMEAIADVGRRDRGLDRRPAQAGRRDLSGARVPRDGDRRRHAAGAVVRRARARPARPRVRARRSSCWSSLGVKEIAVFERRRAAHGAARMSFRSRHRLRRAPLRGGPAAGAGRRDRALATAASPATPTPTC